MRIYDDENGWRVGARHGAYIEESGLEEDRYAWWKPKMDSSGTDDAGGPEAAARYAHYSDNDAAGLIETAPYEQSAVAHDIYANVLRNSYDDDEGGSRPGPIICYTVS